MLNSNFYTVYEVSKMLKIKSIEVYDILNKKNIDIVKRHKILIPKSAIKTIAFCQPFVNAPQN